MTIKLLCVGKITEPYLREAIADYLKRLRRYTPFEYVEIKAEQRGHKYSAQATKERECVRVRQAIKPQEFVVALDEKGIQYSSVEFSHFLARFQIRGDIKTLTFVTGGATGFSESFLQEAQSVLSLSKMTFPHQLCRLILVEQLYRAYTIMAGESYHKS
jgi:23S rRNA (pseudouridine1915-N3)-methyltransferase